MVVLQKSHAWFCEQTDDDKLSRLVFGAVYTGENDGKNISAYVYIYITTPVALTLEPPESYVTIYFINTLDDGHKIMA